MQLSCKAEFPPPRAHAHRPAAPPPRTLQSRAGGAVLCPSGPTALLGSAEGHSETPGPGPKGRCDRPPASPPARALPHPWACRQTRDSVGQVSPCKLASSHAWLPGARAGKFPRAGGGRQGALLQSDWALTPQNARRLPAALSPSRAPPLLPGTLRNPVSHCAGDVLVYRRPWFARDEEQ